MDNLTSAKARRRGLARRAAANRTLWIMSLLYIGTFGSFIGFAGVFPKSSRLLPGVLPIRSARALSLAFLGALVGSLARPLGGTLADRIGGARVTSPRSPSWRVGAPWP